jgi:uncharacterized protein (DUF885 family)
MRTMRTALSLALALSTSAAACSKSATPAKAPPKWNLTDVGTCEPLPPPAVAADPATDARRQQLTALLAEHWEYTLAHAPEFASILGDRRYNDRWSDASLGAIAKDLEESKKFLARFEAIDTTGFPEQEALNQQLMVRSLKESLEGARFESWLMPVNQMSGIHIQLPQLAAMLQFASVKDYEDYIKRLETLPTVLEQTVLLMKAGLAKGLMPPKILLDRAVPQAEGLAKQKPDESPFAMPLGKFPASIAKADQDRLRAALLAAIEKRVLPAYVAFATYLREEYAPKGRTDLGVWALPDGPARYAFAVKSFTTSPYTPDQLHEIGLQEVARIEAEQEAIGKRLGFADLKAFREHIRANPKLRAQSREEIIERYQKHTDAMYAVIPKLFCRLPKQKMVIEQTEPFREKEAAGAEYQQGTQDGTRPGRVLVNTSSPNERLWLDMESTAYHEGVPGHHLQIAIQQELAELPPFRQQAYFGAFQEGWALYSERLGREIGFYQDPYSEYGHLQDEMLRAIRLVVDTGVHAKKWSRDQMVQFFRDHSTIDEPSVQNETDRYIAWPGQALSYKVGQLTILRLRDEAQASLGGAFDIRRFHDEVLGGGPLPLDVLEVRVDAWVAAQKGGAAAPVAK